MVRADATGFAARVKCAVTRQMDLVQVLRLLGFLFCFATLGAGGMAVWGSYVRARAEAWDMVTDLAQVLAEQTFHHTQVVDLLLQDIQYRAAEQDVRSEEDLVRAFQGSDGQRFMSALAQALPAHDGLVLFGADGATISRGHPDRDPHGRPVSIADRPYFQALRDRRIQGLVFGDPAISRGNGLLSVFAGKRIEAADGRFLGVAVASLATGYFSESYEPLARNRHLSISLLRTDGKVLARYPAAQPETGAVLGSIPLESPWYDVVRHGGGTFQAPGLLVNHRVIVAARPVPEYPLVIDVVADEISVGTGWLQRSASVGMLTVALALAVLVVFIGLARRVRSHELHTEALRASEERLDRAQEIAGLGSWEHDMTTGVNIWSRNLFRLRGLDPSVVPSETLLETTMSEEESRRRKDWYNEFAAGRQPPPLEMLGQRPDGSEAIFQIVGRPIADADGVVRRLAGTTRDITQLRLLERELIQAQKMDAIGNLAGGIAHDFNNLLGVIIANLDLLRPMLKDGAEEAELCDEALDGATRGADLVQHLLAFARRQPLLPRLTDVNALVADVGRLLRRTLGDAITPRIVLGEGVGSAMVDPTQLQASLVNLGTNARDAMPHGGRLHIVTGTVSVDAANQAYHEDLAPGAYVTITVRDTGVGMDAALMSRIFEPFFTTKGPDKGSGLGLAMVFGFVEQSGGRLAVRSEPDVGSAFRLYLPCAGGDAAVPADPAPAGAVERVLLVDDHAGFRRATARQLQALGCQVREVADGNEALALLRGPEPVDLLLTDLVLPNGPDGLDLAALARHVRPSLRVLVMSGSPAGRDTKVRLGRWGRPVLGKPFFMDELAAALRGEAGRRVDTRRIGDIVSH
jgi:PAS domain S-box-containing protein